MTNLPHITAKQQDILRLIYRYRFINRIQLQAILGHVDKRRSSRWLKDLKEKQYIAWIYDDTNLTNKTTPAIYYLGLNGIRWLREHEDYPPEELRKRYKDSTKKPDFIARSMLIADCGVNLTAKTVGRTKYTFMTAADYTDPNNEYNFLEELKPHLCFVKETPLTKTNYLVEIFDASTPRYMVKKRLQDYVEYLSTGQWESDTDDEEPPIVLIVCPAVAELAYAKRRTRTLLRNSYGEENPEDIMLRFATTAQLKAEGVTGIIWEDV
jgi:hypothetical protein